MNIDSIENGLVIDHIAAGNGMKIYNLLGLQDIVSSQGISVAIIQNVSSKKMGKKDIIKIDAADIDINYDVIGFVDPDATVNVIKNGVRVDKKVIELPDQITNVVKCKNPRCITTTEQELPHIFRLTDKEKKVYRCIYCETQAK